MELSKQVAERSAVLGLDLAQALTVFVMVEKNPSQMDAVFQWIRKVGVQNLPQKMVDLREEIKKNCL